MTALPSMMTAAMWLGPGRPLSLQQVPTPAVEAPDDVLVRMRSAMFGAALARAVRIGHPKMTPPGVLGTLVAGDVVAIGSAVHNVQLGQRVTLDPHPPCGTCANCRDGEPALCSASPGIEPGAHAEYVRIRHPLTAHLWPIPDGVSYAEAMLTEIVACVLDAVDTARVGPGADVVVFGCGPVAMIAIQLTRLRGADRVFCTVNRATRAALVAQFGAIAVESEAAEQQLLAATGGRGAKIVIEAVGSGATYQSALRVVRAGGTVIGFGGCSQETEIPINPNDIHYRRLSLIGSYHYRPGVFEAAAALLESGTVNVGPLITHRVGLKRIDQALPLFANPDRLVLVIEP